MRAYPAIIVCRGVIAVFISFYFIIVAVFVDLNGCRDCMVSVALHLCFHGLFHIVIIIGCIGHNIVGLALLKICRATDRISVHIIGGRRNGRLF